eukprot:6461552-Amphidinium_carterae.1
MEAASAHPLFTRDPTIDTMQHSSPADPFSRTLVQAYADEVNTHEQERMPMHTALDSQSTQTIGEDHSQEFEGADVLLTVDSQSHTTTASYMSDVESCFDVQHESDMRMDDAAVCIGEQSESDHSDLMEFMQSPSQPNQATSSGASGSCQRTTPHSEVQPEVNDTPRPTVTLNYDPSAHGESSCSTQVIQQHLPVARGRRAIISQPSPPAIAITTPQQPQPAQPTAVQEMGVQHPPTETAQPSHCREETESRLVRHRNHIELVYHGRFAPFHLGHLAVVEAAVALIQVAMRPAVITTWVAMVPAKHLPKHGLATDPVLARFANGPHRRAIIEA